MIRLPRPARRRSAPGVLLVFSLLVAVMRPFPSQAADPYEIFVVLALTGPAAFAGQGQEAALLALEPAVNRTGGINGRPVKFVIKDDQSEPRIAVQLINEITAEAKKPFIIGPSDVSSCNAAFPLVAKTGPLIYCLSTSSTPLLGGYGFGSSPDFIVSGVRYFRLKGVKRIALITANDATGQTYGRAVPAALALPENKDVQLVDHEYYNTIDLNANAQISRVKMSDAQVLIVGSAGTSMGLVLRAIRDIGLQIPMASGSGNATYASMDQYASILPPKWYFFSFGSLLPNGGSDGPTRAVLSTYRTALEAAGIRPDGLQGTAWDPAIILLSALRKLGPNATATEMRDYVAHLRGFVGVNGRYDFVKTPMNGLDASDTVIGAWDPGKHGWTAASAPGGVPLPGS